MKRTNKVFGSLGAFALLTSALAADFASGKRAYDQRDYTKAAREWQVAADTGDPAAQFWLGTLYSYEMGVEKDEETGLRLQLLGAKGGNEYAQRVLGWPFTADDIPFLTCAPRRPSTSFASDEHQPVQADSIRGFEFRVTLHNARPLLERPIMSDENVSERPKHPNIQVFVYRVENGHRVIVPHKIFGAGGGGNPVGNSFAIKDQYLLASVRIPVEEAERRLYIEQFLARLAAEPGQTAEKVERARQMMLHSNSPDEPSYLDNMMPNRLGTYEIVCRYQSLRPGFWPDSLEAPPLRFEYVKTMNWIEMFSRKKDDPK